MLSRLDDNQLATSIKLLSLFESILFVCDLLKTFLERPHIERQKLKKYFTVGQ